MSEGSLWMLVKDLKLQCIPATYQLMAIVDGYNYVNRSAVCGGVAQVLQRVMKNQGDEVKHHLKKRNNKLQLNKKLSKHNLLTNKHHQLVHNQHKHHQTTLKTSAPQAKPAQAQTSAPMLN